MIRVMASLGIIWGLSRDGEVTFEEELSYNYSYFQVRNLGTLVTSVTVPTIKICLKKELSSRYSYKIRSNQRNFVTVTQLLPIPEF